MHGGTAHGGTAHEGGAEQQRTSASRERGAGTVVVLALAAVVVLLALAVGALGAAQRARGAAQAAADLGALAAATAWRQGADPCATATEAVQRNGGQVVECAPEDGGTVGVRASRAALGPEVGPWAGALGDATAHARAGPRPGGSPEQERAGGTEPPPRPERSP
ncbi:Rv3654c family TadE-like protein [Isoptericola sp. F-RaC21]|uniref:Rv3654c family TadE-like protein n=1 Tax=Isoptericola sp. F-RaC21 TaxID=3141452 RepID=UPI00315B7615